MKYAYDKGFKKVAVSLPFFGFLCKKAQRPMEKMLNKMEIPGKVSVRDFKIKGFKGEDIVVKEITPLKTSDAAILVLHGGGFGYKMAPYQFHNACRYADELGCKVFVPDYHLIPDFPFPAAYEDAMLTYQYMVEGAQELEINPDRIMVLGDSAGGALAANVCNTAHAKGLPTPMCQILIYPVIDCEMTTESMKKYPDTPMWNSKNNNRMWKMYLKNASEQDKLIAVPIKNPLPEILPPTYIETAEFDCLHDEGILYAEHIKNVSKNIELYETKGTVHGYDTLIGHDISMNSMNRRIEFMKKWRDA